MTKQQVSSQPMVEKMSGKLLLDFTEIWNDTQKSNEVISVTDHKKWSDLKNKLLARGISYIFFAESKSGSRSGVVCLMISGVSERPKAHKVVNEELGQAYLGGLRESMYVAINKEENVDASKQQQASQGTLF